jgi:hypothetical protein
MTSWAAAGSAIVGLDGQAGFVLANSPTAQQFYRARLGW